MSLKFALLGLLAENPKYGYEIKRQFEGALGNVWSVSYGQLYPTLRWLSELGWVTKKTEPGKNHPAWASGYREEPGQKHHFQPVWQLLLRSTRVKPYTPLFSA